MKSFTKQYVISSTVDKVWAALTDQETMSKWVGEEVKMELRQGGDFSMWKNTIHGKNLEIETNTKLVQEWYGGDWEAPSLVTFEIYDSFGKVGVKLTHENLPEEEAMSFDNGWDEYYMGPVKEFCEKEFVEVVVTPTGDPI